MHSGMFLTFCVLFAYKVLVLMYKMNFGSGYCYAKCNICYGQSITVLHLAWILS